MKFRNDHAKVCIDRLELPTRGNWNLNTSSRAALFSNLEYKWELDCATKGVTLVGGLVSLC
jgi:hypothetical protein